MTPPDVKDGTRAPTRDEIEVGVDIDPRFQERREEVQREASEKRRRILVLVAGGFVALGLLYLLVQSPMLDVDHVNVDGNHHVTADQVREAAGIDLGSPILLLDTDAIAKRVRALPWVEEVDVQRKWSGTLSISVVEEEPVAWVSAGNGVALLSSEGRVIADVDVAPADTTEIKGVRKAPAIGKLLSPPEAAGAVRALPSQLANQVTAIDVGGTGVALELARGAEVRLGNLNDLDAKAAAAIAVLERWGDAPLTYIDVSVPQNPTAR
ncbi:MAG TPA: FtsQ-type POTRA domain-containing protein [Acidimicrobiia bacterium]|nr:FtsQ-type POTRA domain-containing protein [Acidimicrobiia bacterium]